MPKKTEKQIISLETDRNTNVTSPDDTGELEPTATTKGMCHNTAGSIMPLIASMRKKGLYPTGAYSSVEGLENTDIIELVFEKQEPLSQKLVYEINTDKKLLVNIAQGVDEFSKRFSTPDKIVFPSVCRIPRPQYPTPNNTTLALFLIDYLVGIEGSVSAEYPDFNSTVNGFTIEWYGKDATEQHHQLAIIVDKSIEYGTIQFEP